MAAIGLAAAVVQRPNVYRLFDSKAHVLECLEPRDDASLDRGGHDDTAVARTPPYDEVELEVGLLYLDREEDEVASVDSAA